jgi:hypothetical protein
MQGGNTVCQLTCDFATSALQLKVKVEVCIEAGLLAAALAIYSPEVARPVRNSVTLADCGLPSKLYVITLHKAVISELLGLVGPN